MSNEPSIESGDSGDSSVAPPPLPRPGAGAPVGTKGGSPRSTLSIPKRIALGALVVVGVLMTLGRVLGWWQPARVPTGAMSPAIRPGEHLFWESISYAWGAPARGDVMVFDASRVTGLSERIQERQIWLKRVVGLPGERVALVGGELIIDGRSVALSNEAGRLRYDVPESMRAAFRELRDEGAAFVVPADAYFVLGDNATNSYDSRYWGVVPAAAVEGRVAVRYWPPDRFGQIR